jgi:hypothetical protein
MNAKFEVNQRQDGETVKEFVQRCKLTLDEIVWVESQAVVGDPSLPRLRAALADAGFEVLELNLSNDGEDLEFRVRVTERVAAPDSDALLRLWIAAFRQAGFQLGFEEIAVIGVEDAVVRGRKLAGPIAEIAERGAR